jgi:hypothetical protein
VNLTVKVWMLIVILVNVIEKIQIFNIFLVKLIVTHSGDYDDSSERDSKH